MDSRNCAASELLVSDDKVDTKKVSTGVFVRDHLSDLCCSAFVKLLVSDVSRSVLACQVSCILFRYL